MILSVDTKRVLLAPRRQCRVYWIPSKHKILYNICTTSAQRLRRWSSIVQMLHICFVFTGSPSVTVPVYIVWAITTEWGVGSQPNDPRSRQTPLFKNRFRVDFHLWNIASLWRRLRNKYCLCIIWHNKCTRCTPVIIPKYKKWSSSENIFEYILFLVELLYVASNSLIGQMSMYMM